MACLNEMRAAPQVGKNVFFSESEDFQRLSIQGYLAESWTSIPLINCPKRICWESLDIFWSNLGSWLKPQRGSTIDKSTMSLVLLFFLFKKSSDSKCSNSLRLHDSSWQQTKSFTVEQLPKGMPENTNTHQNWILIVKDDILKKVIKYGFRITFYFFADIACSTDAFVTENVAAS